MISFFNTANTCADRPITQLLRCCMRLLVCAPLLVLSSVWAQGNAYPNKPITLVVTYPPGGGADVMARLVAPKLG